MGMNAVIKKENELTTQDILDKDLCISIGMISSIKNILFIGGDSTYLKAAGIIETEDKPILGINSDPTRRTCALCNESLSFEEREK